MAKLATKYTTYDMNCYKNQRVYRSFSEQLDVLIGIITHTAIQHVKTK